MPYVLRKVYIPGTLSTAYVRGSEIHESVVSDWELAEGLDWAAEMPGEDGETPRVARPVDDSDRGAWVAYVVARGTDPEVAADLDLKDLMERYPEDDEADGNSDRPADSAVKKDWIDYVIAQGGDETWARNATKAELQDWRAGTTRADRQATTDAAADQGNATVGA